MTTPSRAFQRRLAALLVGLAVSVMICGLLAVAVQRDASDKLRALAHVDLEAASLARQFRAAVDDLHGALLRIGTDASEDSATIIQERRQKLSAWLSGRQTRELSGDERKIVQQMAAETRSYFLKLDALNVRASGLSDRLDRDTVVMFDDSANRLQSIADDFAAAHDEELRSLLEASLRSLLRMRNLIFGCLVLLLAAIGAVGALLYGDVVRPLREQLVNSEALLAKREKLAALGTLAAGVAHEIRNPLTAMKARLYTLRRILSSDESREDVQAIENEVARLECIVRDVLGYARPADAALERVELSAWLREFAAFVGPELTAARIEIAVDAEAKTDVDIDTNQLRQIMLNLVRNAQDAFEGRPGRIGLALRREQVSTGGKMSEAAVLSVTDDGPGIPAKIQARLFDPFFTTKPTGTGLGLSIVARLVDNQGGKIAFQSAPGAGTRFAVRLPIINDRPQTRRK
jgi:signal transduction histidine kinase